MRQVFNVQDKIFYMKLLTAVASECIRCVGLNCIAMVLVNLPLVLVATDGECSSFPSSDLVILNGCYSDGCVDLCLAVCFDILSVWILPYAEVEFVLPHISPNLVSTKVHIIQPTALEHFRNEDVSFGGVDWFDVTATADRKFGCGLFDWPFSRELFYLLSHLALYLGLYPLPPKLLQLIWGLPLSVYENSWVELCMGCFADDPIIKLRLYAFLW